MKLNELIEKYKRYEGKWNNKTGELARQIFLEDLKQLDELQPVKVPPSVAEKIEYFKKTGDWDLFQAMDYLFEKKEIREWLEDKNNQETFARAWLDGYEVEEEKRCRVKIKGTSQYLRKDENSIFFSSFFISDFTRNDIEDLGFGWVFDCEGIEIEEVEHEE